MVFCRTFDNLEWAALKKNHHQRWGKLKDSYKLSPDQIESPKSLDDLARQCVDLCRKHLFSEPGTSLRGWKMQSKHGVSCVVDVEDALSPALCDHLIVTFAHRFYCDNLKPKDIRECLAAIYDCQGNYWVGTQSEKDKDFLREQKKNCVDANSLKSQNYRKGITAFVVNYKSWIRRLHIAEEGEPLSPGTADVLNQEFAMLDDWLKRRDLFAAPNWLFTAVMANNWKNHPFNGKKNRWIFARDYKAKANLMAQMASFMGDNAWFPLLIEKEPIAQAEKSEKRTYLPMELTVGERPFICVPYTPDNLLSELLPAQKYALRGCQRSVEIPVAVQTLFNNYLLEQNFHGYAIAVALDCIRARMGDSDPGKREAFRAFAAQYLKLPFVIRLHAPLVHPELIRIADAVIGQMDSKDRSIDCLAWLDWFISIWNREALPVLEELFLWGVRTYFDFDALLSEIESSLTQRGNRLNCYRLVPDTLIAKYDKAYTPMISEVVKNGYCAGLGMRCSEDPYTGTWVDSGMRTVLDD